MFRSMRTALALLVGASLVSACGGGGEIRSASAIDPLAGPTPTPSPTPTPTPAGATSGGVVKPEVITVGTYPETVALAVTETIQLSPSRDTKLSGSKDVANITSSSSSGPDTRISIEFDDYKQNYRMTLPGGRSGYLDFVGLEGSHGAFATATIHRLVDSSGQEVASVWMPVAFGPISPFTYSHFGSWVSTEPRPDNSATQVAGWFVYGYEAPGNVVPRHGTAQYDAQIHANSPMDPFVVGGTANLVFDFGRGQLTGQMHPVHFTNGFYPALDHDYGVFKFVDTLYSIGNARYSGAFAKDGNTISGSWFDGSLTGPYADEVIGRFSVPFERNGKNGSLTGIWIGKKK